MDLYLHVGIQVFSQSIGYKIAGRNRVMEFFLQFGYGMMDHCRSLIREWGGGSVILSPRDLNKRQLQTIASDLRELGGSLLLDPQFYLPHSDHKRLQQHDYWPKSYESGVFWSGSDLTDLLTSLLNFNQELGCREFIVPGLYASRVNSDWLERQQAFLEEANAIKTEGLNLIATVALSEEVTRDENQIHEILDVVDSWDVNGVYLVCEHPNGEYFVKDPNWLANVLDLVAGFRLKGKKVIIGYCNQQMLVAACAATSGIASGTWMNVRSFFPEKFQRQYEEEIKQRVTLYYCPTAFSEYKIPFLDIAARLGLLSDMVTSPTLESRYADILFQGPRPSSVGFTEQFSFRHYLHCLRNQAINTKQTTFSETVSFHQLALNTAEELLNKLHIAGVRAQNRDFMEIIDTNRAALAVLEASRGPILRRYWHEL